MAVKHLKMSQVQLIRAKVQSQSWEFILLKLLRYRMETRCQIWMHLTVMGTSFKVSTSKTSIVTTKMDSALLWVQQAIKILIQTADKHINHFVPNQSKRFPKSPKLRILQTNRMMLWISKLWMWLTYLQLLAQAFKALIKSHSKAMIGDSSLNMTPEHKENRNRPQVNRDILLEKSWLGLKLVINNWINQ